MMKSTNKISEMEGTGKYIYENLRMFDHLTQLFFPCCNIFLFRWR